MTPEKQERHGSEAGPSDEECISRTANGDASAFAILWRRHSGAAYAVARSYHTLDADDLVSESFAKVLRAIRNGGGPEVSFRAYLFTTIRNTAATQLKNVTALSIDRDFDPDTFDELAIEAPDVSVDSVSTRAFRQLPERWQKVLWLVGVEGLSPVEAAPHLALSPNGVSALAMRARKALRREMVVMASADLPEDSPCRPALLAKVGALPNDPAVASTSSREHSIDTCNQCRAILGEQTAGRASISIAILVAAIGSGAISNLVPNGAVTMATPVTISASGVGLPAVEPTSSASLSTSSIANVTATKVIAGLAVIAAAYLALVSIPSEQASTPRDDTAVEVFPDTSPGEPTAPTQEPEPTVSAAPFPPDRRAPEPATPRQQPSGLGNGAAPQFELVPQPLGLPVAISGLGTPGWTVEAFVTQVSVGVMMADSRDSPIPDDPAMCPRPPGSESASVYSTGPLPSASWKLTFWNLQPGSYTVVVVECVRTPDSLVASVSSTPISFTSRTDT